MSHTAGERRAPGPARLGGPPIPRTLQTVLSSPPFDERFFELCTRRYGPTFRVHLFGYGRMVVTSDLDLVERLFVSGKDQGVETWAPGGSVGRVFGSNPFLETEGERHKEYRRRLAGPLRRLASDNSHTERLAERIEAAVDAAPVERPFGLWDMIEPILFDSVLETLGFAHAGQRARLRAAFHAYHATGFRPTLAEPSMYELTRRGRLRRRFDDQERALTALIADELASGRDAGIREELLSASRRWAEETGRDPRLVGVDFIKGFVGAGSRTTAAGAVWTLLLLLHDRVMLDRTRAELADGGGLLLGAAREALRLYPPLPIAPVRRLIEPIRAGSVELPGGTVLAVLATLLHRNPQIYPGPKRFWPERYDVLKPPSHAWLPFGLGLRRCLGQHWALERMVTIIEVIVRHGGIRARRPAVETRSRSLDVCVPRSGGEVVKTHTRAVG